MKLGTHTRRLLSKRKFAMALVHFIIENEWLQNRGRFKPGDKVKYNWMAKVYISTAIEHKKEQTLTITKLLCDDLSGVDYEYQEEGQIKTGSCDPFWLTKTK